MMGISEKRVFGFLACEGGAMGYECMGHSRLGPIVLNEFLQIYLGHPQVPITWVCPFGRKKRWKEGALSAGERNEREEQEDRLV